MVRGDNKTAAHGGVTFRGRCGSSKTRGKGTAWATYPLVDTGEVSVGDWIDLQRGQSGDVGVSGGWLRRWFSGHARISVPVYVCVSVCVCVCCVCVCQSVFPDSM